ncbi:MAG: hypothetical protein CM1200mP16_10390 [Nitrospina sp.]|nr:MAG: hypothetical protein CM1200mP16_10390 [Nitrospina sp.]
MLTAIGKYDPTPGKPINQPKSAKQIKPDLEIAEPQKLILKLKKRKKKVPVPTKKWRAPKKVNETTNVTGEILIKGKS